MELWEHQAKAVEKLKNGSVLVGGTGSGKSLTALSYYIRILGELKNPPETLYILTTAKKRDEGDWQREATRVGIDDLVVDSWNNIKKYLKVRKAFFIFDEQRVIGYGTWARSFIRITRRNRWILLSATPADTWMDLIPVFIANDFYRNKTEFVRTHVVYAPYVKFPKIVGYRNEELLERYKNQIFVTMDYEKQTIRHIVPVPVRYNKHVVDELLKTQWNPFSNKPVQSLAEEVFTMRRLINMHPSRIFALMKIQELAKRLIIYYNFNFELWIMKNWFTPLTDVAEYNGTRHDAVPKSDEWVYLVQYNSGAEAWECFTTNHMAYYSMNYSYRTVQQTRGRIDRNNSTFTDLWYYELISDSILDKAILDAFGKKKNFNIRMLTLKSREYQML